MRTWKSRIGYLATYKASIEVFIKAGKVAYADFMCDFLFRDTANMLKLVVKLKFKVKD